MRVANGCECRREACVPGGSNPALAKGAQSRNYLTVNEHGQLPPAAASDPTRAHSPLIPAHAAAPRDDEQEQPLGPTAAATTRTRIEPLPLRCHDPACPSNRFHSAAATPARPTNRFHSAAAPPHAHRTASTPLPRSPHAQRTARRYSFSTAAAAISSPLHVTSPDLTTTTVLDVVPLPEPTASMASTTS